MFLSNDGEWVCVCVSQICWTWYWFKLHANTAFNNNFRVGFFSGQSMHLGCLKQFWLETIQHTYTWTNRTQVQFNSNNNDIIPDNCLETQMKLKQILHVQSEIRIKYQENLEDINTIAIVITTAATAKKATRKKYTKTTHQISFAYIYASPSFNFLIS